MYFFKNNQHARSFAALWALSQKNKDREFLSALYVLGAIDKNLEPYVSPKGINFEALKAQSQSWSSGEKALLKLAAAVFNSALSPTTVDDVFYSLDSRNFQVAVEGLKMRYVVTA